MYVILKYTYMYVCNTMYVHVCNTMYVCIFVCMYVCTYIKKILHLYLLNTAQVTPWPQEPNISQPSPPNRTGFRSGGRIELMPPPPLPHQPQPQGHRWGHGCAVGERSEEGEEGKIQEIGAEDAGIAQEAEMREELPVDIEQDNEGMDFDEAGIGVEHDMRDVEGGEEEGEEYHHEDEWGQNLPPGLPHIPGMFGGGGQGGWPARRGKLLFSLPTHFTFNRGELLNGHIE